MVDVLKKFNRDVSLERFRSHSQNQSVELIDLDSNSDTASNEWKCGILWGNSQINGLIIVDFTTLNVLAMSSDIFKNTLDDKLFELTKDFMKEYCNFYAGYIKGIFNNSQIDVNLSLPILSKKICPESCYNKNMSFETDSWTIKSGSSQINIYSYFSISDKNIDLSFLSASEAPKKKSNIEFF